MRILVINCGSSTLKSQLLRFDPRATPSGSLRALAHGIVDRIGESAHLAFSSEKGKALEETAAVADHEDAARRVLVWLSSTAETESEGLSVVAHRVVHGGDRFSEPTLIDDGVMQGLEDVSSPGTSAQRTGPQRYQELSQGIGARGATGGGVRHELPWHDGPPGFWFACDTF